MASLNQPIAASARPAPQVAKTAAQSADASLVLKAFFSSAKITLASKSVPKAFMEKIENVMSAYLHDSIAKA